MMIEQALPALPFVLLAALVRGYSGFGFAAIAIVGMNLAFDPSLSVPVILALDLACSIGIWKQAKAQADKVTFGQLTIGSLLGIPLGVAVLFVLPTMLLKLGTSLLVLLFVLLLAFRLPTPNFNSPLSRYGIGLGSGTCTAAASVGGPLIIYYMLSSRLSIPQQRATMILYFIVSELLALMAIVASSVLSDTFDAASFYLFLVLVVPVFLSVHLGQYLFNKWPPSSFKYVALPVMALVGTVGLWVSASELLA